jgi:hypothetical protein
LSISWLRVVAGVVEIEVAVEVRAGIVLHQVLLLPQEQPIPLLWVAVEAAV